MREVIRDLDGASPCPRCGRPVLYKGRGRPPVWCSSQCRIEASIERKGNRALGVQPEVAKVVPVHTKLTAREKDRRATIEAELPEELAVARVASSSNLVAELIDRLVAEHPTADDPIWMAFPRSLPGRAGLFTARSDDDFPPFDDEPTRRRRSAADWATLLEELATALSNGQVYNRELYDLFGPLKQVVEKFERRRTEWGRF